MARAFVIRPFEKKADAKGRIIDFEEVHRVLIQPALDEAGLQGSTTGEIVDAGNIREDMFSLILEADLVVADFSVHNANVFYELGIRHALRPRHTVLIRERDSQDHPPFDLLTDRFLKYTLGSEEDRIESRKQLVAMIVASLRTNRDTDSPVFKMLPNLPEPDLSAVQVLPLDFQDEVTRAREGGSKGWLRLLADDVMGRRFQWPALELIGKTQWDLNDHAGARDTWERVRTMRPDSVTANLALANIYERLSRLERKPEDIATRLVLSEQALGRVLKPGTVSSSQRVEAMSLQGRNQKTRWRMDFESLPTLEQRRSVAVNGLLRESFEAYRDAFREDLNHFWSGLAALQMGTILLDLTSGPGDGWKVAFEDDDQATTYRTMVERDLVGLRHVVATSIDGALKRLPKNHADRPWAEVSKADAYFLLENDPQRVLNRYRDVLKGRAPFYRDAVLGQLRLFSSLGVRANVADVVLAAFDTKSEKEKPEKAPKPLHAILFAGHRIDAPGRPVPRFPPSQAGVAKEVIARALEPLQADYELVGLASGATGGDILFHEVCAKLGIKSTMCLPFRADLYAAQEFGELDDWRSRFFALKQSRDLLELSDLNVLPRWLSASSVNPWERGNRWVLQMGLTRAEKVSLLALWDGKKGGPQGGGTAHMVELARKDGNVDVRILEVGKLGHDPKVQLTELPWNLDSSMNTRP